MNQKRKLRLYALFQFFSFISILLLFFAVISFAVAASEHGLKVDSEFWAEVFSEMLQFSTNEVVGTFSSILVYISLLCWVITWPLGWSIIKVNDRNLFDQLFLLFSMAPAISNLFALLAQIYQDSVRFTTEKLTNEEIREEHTQILKLLKENKKGIEKEVTKALNTNSNQNAFSKITKNKSATNLNKAINKHQKKQNKYKINEIKKVLKKKK